MIPPNPIAVWQPTFRLQPYLLSNHWRKTQAIAQEQRLAPLHDRLVSAEANWKRHKILLPGESIRGNSVGLDRVSNHATSSL